MNALMTTFLLPALSFGPVTQLATGRCFVPSGAAQLLAGSKRREDFDAEPS